MAQSPRPVSRHLSPLPSRRRYSDLSASASPMVLRRDLKTLPPIQSTSLPRNSIHIEAPALPHRPMSKVKKAVLRKNSILLKSDLDFEDSLILHYLYSQDILSHENFETIKNLKSQSRADQVHKLLKILEKRGDVAFDTFLEALHEEKCYEHVFLKLEADLTKEMSLEQSVFCNWQDSAVYRTPSMTRCDETQLYTEEENPTYIVKRPTFASVVSSDSKEDIELKLNELYETVLDNEHYEELPESYEVYQQVPINNKLAEHNFTIPEMIQEFLDNEKELQAGSHLILSNELSRMIWEISKDSTHSLAYDSHGNMLLVNMNTLKRQGNVIGEKWYYPIAVSSHQISIWLSQTKLKGCFYVYTSTNSCKDGKPYAPFNLSLCHSESGEVTHYRIEQNENNEFVIGDVKNCNGMKFQNIHILVEYFKLNRGCLPCRLRWAPSELEEKPQSDDKIQPEDLEIIHGEELTGTHSISRTSKVFKGRFGGNFVAVKTLTKNPKNRIDEEDFLSEAAILLKIQHKNIRKLVGVCHNDETVHLVLDYVDGSNLKDSLSNGHLNNDATTIVAIWLQVLHALDYLAKNNFIIHRDVAARNCLVQNAESLQVQLSDFGMAVKVIQYDEFLGDADDMFAIRWAAPEVLKEYRFSTKSDVWAVGVLFWEMASGGALPYSNIQHNKVTEKVLAGKFSLGYDDSMDVCYKAILKEMVSPCWKRNPEERPSAEYLITLCNKHIDSMAGNDTIYDSGTSFGGPNMRKSGKGRRSLRGLKDFFTRKK